MLRFLASVSPVAVLLLGAVPAGAVGWFAHGVKFELFDRPAIAREATAQADIAAALRITEAANRAEQAERLRQQRASADALAFYREALATAERNAAAATSKLELEIAAYDAQLAFEGRTCRLTDGDIEWLRDDSADRPNSGR